MVFGGCKNYLGNSKSCDHNWIIYPGLENRSGTGAFSGHRCQTDDNGMFANQYYHNNTCLTTDGKFLNFPRCNASNRSDIGVHVFQTEYNTYLAPNSTFIEGSCGNLSLQEWQALGQDHGSTAGPVPPIEGIIALAKEKLGMA